MFLIAGKAASRPLKVELLKALIWPKKRHEFGYRMGKKRKRQQEKVYRFMKIGLIAYGRHWKSSWVKPVCL
jgi:hypothetical protein